eukprot:m51a1_g3090 hypothetical protein (359) ;mRNA; r:85915-87542
MARFDRLPAVPDDELATGAAQSPSDPAPRPATARVQELIARLKSNGDTSGLLVNTASSFLYSVVTLLVKMTTRLGVAAMELVVIRSGLQLAMCLVWLGASRVSPLGPRKSWALLWTRAVVGIVSMCMWMLAIKMLPLADAVVINFLSPVFTTIFGFLILKERITKAEVGGYLLCFVGILFVARPPFIFGRLADTSGSDIPWKERLVGVKIGKIHPFVVVTYLSASGLVIPPVGCYLFEHFSAPTARAWAYLVLLSFVGFGAQGLLTLALQLGRAGRVMMASYLQIIFAFVWGLVFLHELPSWMSAAWGSTAASAPATAQAPTAVEVVVAEAKSPNKKDEDNTLIATTVAPHNPPNTNN